MTQGLRQLPRNMNYIYVHVLAFTFTLAFGAQMCCFFFFNMYGVSNMRFFNMYFVSNMRHENFCTRNVEVCVSLWNA